MQNNTQNGVAVKATIDRMLKDSGNSKAIASLTIGGAFAIHGIRVISSSKGDFVAMPSRKVGNDYKDIFHAITAEARTQMNDAVMAAYEEQKLLENQQVEKNDAPDVGDSPGDEPVDGPNLGM